jgi:F-type H+-transporting ATPase subunit b
LEGDYNMLKRVIFVWMFAVVGLAMVAPVCAQHAAEAEAATAGEGNMNPLDPSEFKTDLAIWTAVVFVVLAVVLKKFAWGPLAEGLDKREGHIAQQIAQAEEANRQAKDLLAGYEKKLVDAGDEVRKILEHGRRDAEQIGRQMVDKAKEEAQAEQKRAMQQIEAATASAIKELADRSATLAVDLAGKIVHAKLTSADHASLIEQAVAGFMRGNGDSQHVSRN